MADRLSKEAEEVLDIFVDYLNLWHAEDVEAGYEPITRASFDDDQYEIFPRLLMDHIEGDTETRIIRVQADLDDGGGPNILTAFFNRRFDDWQLDYVVQFFDTMYNEVYSDGKLRGPDGMVERG